MATVKRTKKHGKTTTYEVEDIPSASRDLDVAFFSPSARYAVVSPANMQALFYRGFGGDVMSYSHSLTSATDYTGVKINLGLGCAVVVLDGEKLMSVGVNDLTRYVHENRAHLMQAWAFDVLNSAAKTCEYRKAEDSKNGVTWSDTFPYR